jgi:hypothetical protein
MFLARFAVAKAGSDVAAATYIGSNVTAPQFTASLLIGRKLGVANPGSVTFGVSGQSITVFNVLDEEISNGDTILIGQTVDEVWVVHCVY